MSIIFLAHLSTPGDFLSPVYETISTAISDFIVDGTCPPHLASKLKEIVQDLQNS